MPPRPGTVVIWSDVACPWGPCRVARLHRVRDELGLGDSVRFEHRVFPLELVNGRPTPSRAPTSSRRHGYRA